MAETNINKIINWLEQNCYDNNAYSENIITMTKEDLESFKEFMEDEQINGSLKQ